MFHFCILTVIFIHLPKQFNNIKNRIKECTVIIFNEYFNYRNWCNHEYKAFQEFVKRNNIKYDYICFTSISIVTVIIRHIDNNSHINKKI